MANAFFHVPTPVNEPVKGYAPGSPERQELRKALRELKQQERDIPMHIGGQEVRTDKKLPLVPPHDHQHVLGYFSEGDASHVSAAIEAALAARPAWAELPWEQRAAIFLKAADLLAGPYRARLNAATMLGQSKNAFQAEIDAACELIDFFRFNVYYLQELYKQQPESAPGMWNRLEHRPLEGFVFALTPFNFTSIAGNLPTSVALMGNVAVWKPAYTQIYSAQVLMELFQEAGLPAGVINLIYVDGPVAGDVVFQHRDFAGIHFTGSTGVFQTIWKTIGENIHKYRSYPRIVGETGGKDFIVAHPSAHAKAVAVAISRGAFEYQGQKCSAASRVYLPANLADEILGYVKQDLASFKMGDVEDFGNFINAVIDEKAFDKLAKYIDGAQADPSGRHRGRRRLRQVDGLLHRAHRYRNPGPEVRDHVRGAIWAGRDGVRLRGENRLRGHAGAGRPNLALRPDRRRVRPGPLRHRPGHAQTGAGRRQLLHQRQAHRGRGGPAALRRGPRLRHQRQGRLPAKSAALGVAAHHQRNLRARDGLPLPVLGCRA